MIIQVMTIFVVPLFQAMWREHTVTRENRKAILPINNAE